MNAPVNTSAPKSITSTIVGLVLFILVVVGLYYLYNFLYGTNPSYGSVSLMSGSKSATETVSVDGQQAVSATALTGILDGGQYTVSFWVYVADAKGFNENPAKLAHLIEISNNRFGTGAKGNTLLFVGLNPRNGSLVVRQSANDDQTINNANDSTSLTSLITNYNTGSYGSDDRCDIMNGIEYQRWIYVTVVGNGRTLDVYLDGKLARSCVYKGPYALGNTAGTASSYVGLNNGGALKGYFATATYYNYALTPDKIWAQYQAGPTGYFDISSFFKNLFSVDVSFGGSAGLNTKA